MKYEFKNRPTGKTFSEMTQLKANIEKGLYCAVATYNPEKFKKLFECITESKLFLKPHGKDIYTAFLNEKL